MSKGTELMCFGCDLPVRREEDLPPNYTLNRPSSSNSGTATAPSVAVDEVQLSNSSDLSPAQMQASTTDNHSNTPAVEKEMPAKKSWDDLPDLDDETPDVIDEEEDFEFDAEAFARARKKSDEVSEKIGKHMLMGWTLMDIHCSTDYCPLMRSVDRKSMKCLSCGTEYEEEGDAEDIVKITVPPSVVTKELPLNPSSCASTARAPTSCSISSSSSSSLLAATNPQASSNVRDPVAEEIAATKQALVAKLAWARGLLLETRNLSECQQIAETIRVLLQATSALFPYPN
jgi:uncharacterized Zn finger protein (UPF0148 family)